MTTTQQYHMIETINNLTKKMTTIKTSISLNQNIWTHLKTYQNRSSVINKALELFFSREERIKKADEDYWNNIEKSLRTGDGAYASLNPKQETITKETLTKKLWN